MSEHFSTAFRIKPFSMVRTALPMRFPGLQLLGLAIVAVVSLPLIYLIIRASSSGIEGIEYLLQPRTLRIVTNSLILTVVVVLASGIIGILFAWLTTRTDLPCRRILLVVGLMPMVIPSYIGALTLLAAFGPVGYLQQVLETFGIQRLPEIYGFAGASVAITLFTYPYFVLPVRAAMLGSDRALEETAQSLGCSDASAFWRVTFPMLRPAIATGALLTALYTLSDFGAVMVMRYNAFSRAIYVTYNSSFDRDRAALLAFILVILTVFLVWMEGRVTKRMYIYRVGKGSVRYVRRVVLRRWRIPALAFCLGLIGIGVILPIGVLFGWALNPYITGTLDFYPGELIGNAVGSSAATALMVGLAALPLAIIARRSFSAFSRVLIALSYIGNALPGIVIGLALVFFGVNVFPSLYQTLPLLILSYTIRFLPYGIASTRSALAGISPSIEDAAQSLGLNSRQILLRVTIPLTWVGIAGGMALVFLNAMKELPTTLMLAPIGFRTLATRIWSASESGALALVGLPGLLLILFSCLGLALLFWRERQATP